MSEQKTAKVTGILECRKYEGQNGTVYYHKLELDNGEVGTIGKKKANAFNVGDSLTYTSEESQYGLKFKAVQSNGFAGGGKTQGSPASFCLSYSKDLMCAMVAAGKTADLKALDIANATLIVSDRWLKWLKENQ